MEKNFAFKEAMRMFCAYLSNPAYTHTSNYEYERERIFHNCLQEVQKFYHGLQDNFENKQRKGGE